MDSDVPRLTIGMEEELSGDITELSEHLCTMRRFVSDTVSEHNMAIIASSTHPFAEWGSQRHVNKRRYNILAEALQGVVRRLLICGMHVHIGIDDEDQRIDMMNQVSYFLPHLLALSGSSPFWHGEDTGLKSYRPAIFRALPRTGLPDEFLSWSDYRRHVDVLVDTGVIEDASKLWWDIRPSDRYPTLEMRSADICTRYEDGITIAAVYQAIIAMLHHRRMNNQKWRIYSRMLISENSWRAWIVSWTNSSMSCATTPMRLDHSARSSESRKSLPRARAQIDNAACSRTPFQMGRTQGKHSEWWSIT